MVMNRGHLGRDNFPATPFPRSFGRLASTAFISYKHLISLLRLALIALHMCLLMR